MTNAVISRVHGSTVLIVSGKNTFRGHLAGCLRDRGVAVVTVERAEEALLRVETVPPRLVVADERVLDDSSLDACRRMQRSMQSCGGLFLLLSEFNANQTFGEPGPTFAPADLEPRRSEQLVHGIIALLASAFNHSGLETGRTHAGLHLDRQRQRAAIDEQPLDVTPTEFRILWSLIEQPGFVLSRDELMEASRGTDAVSHGRTIDAHIRSIRKKLASRSELIETVRGYGYRLSETESPSDNTASLVRAYSGPMDRRA